MYKKILSVLLLAIAAFAAQAELRDPTRPAYPVSAETTVDNIELDPQLSAIWISKKSRRATLNGIHAKQGQTIAGNIKIIKIRKNAVTINQNGNIKTLQLLQRPYKTQ